MDAEIQFFMSEQDQAEFLVYATEQLDSVDSSADVYQFVIGDCRLQFLPTQHEGDILYAGKLEIRLSKPEQTCKNLMRAQTVYKRLRNWIKKHYWSRLAYFDKNKNDRLTPSRVHWLGSEAKQWKEANPDKHLLKLSKTSWMTFELGF